MQGEALECAESATVMLEYETWHVDPAEPGEARRARVCVRRRFSDARACTRMRRLARAHRLCKLTTEPCQEHVQRVCACKRAHAVRASLERLF